MDVLGGHGLDPVEVLGVYHLAEGSHVLEALLKLAFGGEQSLEDPPAEGGLGGGQFGLCDVAEALELVSGDVEHGLGLEKLDSVLYGGKVVLRSRRLLKL